MKILRKDLFIKKSGIPKAGKGLFTKVAIHPGDRIIEYKGRLERWKDVKHEDGYNGYLLRLDRSTAINALPYRRALGRFANDAAGLQRVPGIRNNAAYNIYGNRCFIEATRAIPVGGEILVSYGREFWTLKRRIMAMETVSR